MTDHENHDSQYKHPADKRREQQELRLQAVRDHSPAVQDGPYAWIHEDKHLSGE